MKKKEAVYKIKNILDNLDVNCGNNLKAQIIIMELERVGMLPPLTEKLKKYTSDGQMIEILEKVHEWED